MLLPSALSCDGGRAIPSSASMLLSPAPRHATRIPQVALFAPSPAIGRDESSSSARSSAVEGIFMTCKRLHQILSLEPPRSASPAPQQVSATTQTHNAFNRAITAPLPTTDALSTSRNCASQTASVASKQPRRLSVPSEIPRTPTPTKSDIVRIPKTPMRRNKRCRADDTDDDGFYHIRVQNSKRPRLSTLPASTTNQSRTAQSARFNRRSLQLKNNISMKAVTPEPVIPSTSITPNALQLSLIASSPEEEIPQTSLMLPEQADSGRDWSNAEDRLLVEMVLQKMRLSPRDWADCARSLGRDPRTVGNRWEMIVGGLMGGVREGRVGGPVQKRKRLEDTERR